MFHSMSSTGTGPRRRRWLVGLLALVLLTGYPATPVQAVDFDPREFAQNLNRSAMNQHVQQLQLIADANGGDRRDGSPGALATVAYLEAQLTGAGYQVQRQEFTTAEGVRSLNLLAETGTGNPEQVIMFGAHYDSEPGSPGINDNASALAAVLQVALELAQTPPLRNQVRFGFWGAEEQGLQGSDYYVENLGEAKQQIVVYYNFDGIGSPNYIIGVENGRGRFLGPEFPTGSAQAMDLLTSYFDTVNQPWQPNEGCCTDYLSFTLADVPFGGLHTGVGGSKTEAEAARFGGTVNAPYDPNYHRPGDTISNLNFDALSINAGAIAYAAARLAADATPITD